MLLAIGVLALSAGAVRSDEAPRVPLAPGTIVVFAAEGPDGDREPSFTIRSVAADHYVGVFNSEVDDPRTGRRRPIEIVRRVRMQDQREARVNLSEFWEGDPHTFSGTVPFLSRAMIEELRRGSTTITDRNMTRVFGLPIPHNRSGTLKRVAFEKMPVLVNGKVVPLNVIHARGELRDEATGERVDLDMVALDDPDHPLYLRWHESTRRSQIVRIDYPEPSVAQARLEAALAKRKPLDVYNVYFAFASAELRPQSKAALDDIAAVLRKHPDWKLAVQGHTDDVGGDGSNLELSEARAAAVRDALIQQYGIAPARLTSGGSGARSPVAKNDTPEGRARNRRVVLSRN